MRHVMRVLGMGMGVLTLSWMMACSEAQAPANPVDPGNQNQVKTGPLRNHAQVWGYMPLYSNHPDTKNVPSVAALSKLSHVLLFSVKLADNYGNLDISSMDGNLRVQMLKDSAAIAGTKILLVVGGANVSVSQFGPVAATPETRANFANQIVAAVQKLGLHGADIDWEFPNNLVGDNFRLMLQEIKNRMAGTGLELSVAVHPDHAKMYPNVYAANFCQAVDHVGLMTYDLGTPHAPVDATKYLAEWAAQAGCQPKQLVLGLPFYGKIKNGYSNTKTWAQLMALGCNPFWDNCGEYDYNSITTSKAKTQYVLDNKYGGVMFWEINQDLPSSDPNSLLTNITNILPQ
jgi:GH18 family chitinase